VTAADGRAAVEAYLAAQPPEQRELLADLRRRVLAIVPGAIDAMGYGMPMLRVDGRGLVWFAGWKRHCSVYPVGRGFIAARPELAGYGHTDKGALHFSRSQPLSDAVVADLVRDRLADLAGGTA
jgi:uncharacterized protein YdhG (YjbR/CyaY superfamily)